MSGDVESSSAPTNGLKPQASLNKACDACRSLKVRCLVPTDDISKDCQRCIRFRQECIFSAAKKRKPRQRTDARVAELEKEVSAMRAMMSNGRKVEDPSIALTSTPSSQREESPVLHTEKDPTQTQPMLFFESSRVQPAAILEAGAAKRPDRIGDSNVHESDVVDRGILSIEDAEEFLQVYDKALKPHYPAVVLRHGISAHYIRQAQPVLFLSIMAAVAASRNFALSRKLHLEMNQLLATKVFIQNEKSFELVQSLLINTIFYDPPEKQGQLKFYEFFQMTASMAQDIGLGNEHGPERANQGLTVNLTLDEPDWLANPGPRSAVNCFSELERRRTFLACYLGCVGAASTNRRLSLLRSSRWVDDCIDYLSTPLHAAASDTLLVAYGKLTTILDEINSSLLSHDQVNDLGLQDQRTQLVMKTLLKQLDSWLSETDSEILRGPLLVMYHTCHLFLHENLLYAEHLPSSFLSPYVPRNISPRTIAQNLPPVYIHATSNLISSAQALLDAFLSINPIEVRNLPVVVFVRSLYAVLILAKLYASASNMESSFAIFIDKDSLRLEFYVTAIVRQLQEASGWERLKIPTVFLMLAFKFYLWYKRQQQSVEDKDGMTNESDKTVTSSTRWTSHRNSPSIQASIGMTSGPSFGAQLVNPSLPQPAVSTPTNNTKYSIPSAHSSDQTNIYLPQQGQQDFDADAYWQDGDLESVGIDAFDLPMEMDPNFVSLFDAINHARGYDFSSDS